MKTTCVDCGKEYEAFKAPDGEVTGSGRCPSCRDAHLKQLIATLPQQKQANRKTGEPWAKTQLCKCGQPYQAQHYDSIFGGRDVDTSHGLCPECQVKMQVVIEAQEKEEKDHLTQGKRAEWRRSCGIPEKYSGQGFETWKFGRPGNVDKAYALCLKYADGYPLLTPQGYRTLVLTSPKVWGLGKTHLACGIAHRVLDRWNGEDMRCPVMVITEPDLFGRLRASYNSRNSETEDDILKKLTWVPLLILDDIGKEEVADPRFVQRILFKIISGRYNSMLPMVLTANKSVAELREHLGGANQNEASFDRLMEMCQGEFFKVTGETFRRKG